ncbi:MAG: type II toxin-antitoxin system VapC family toxin [Candidatus Rokuibacteriota bacterium]
MAVVGPSPAFFDTSVLLGGLIELGPGSKPAQRIMAAVAARHLRRPHTAWHCCLEFYAVSTRLPEEVRLSPPDAWRLVEEEILGRFEVRQLSDDRRRPFLQTAAEDGLVSGRIYDAHIAEIARLARVSVVVTDNIRHFAGLRRHGVEVMSTAQFAETITAA